MKPLNFHTACHEAAFLLRRGHEVRVVGAQERAPETRQPPEFHWWMMLDEREG